MTIWSFLHIYKLPHSDLVQVAYKDEIGKLYSWDSTVANHAKVRVLDRVVIVDDQLILGLGFISKIHIEASRKMRSRCPNCLSTKISTRTEVTPVYRCNKCKFEFDKLHKEEIEVLSYMAFYGDSWLPFENLSKRKLEPAYHSKGVQQSIRQLDTMLLPLEVSQYL